MRKRRLLATLALITMFFIAGSISEADAQSTTVHSDTCYDPNNVKDIRLWEGEAPGAIGTDPCTDIPFLRVFTPDHAAAGTSLGVIVMPGGGYNQLIDIKEQAPVARYFADRLGITTFVLYYRLVQANGTYRYPVPMWDAQRAIRWVRANAERYGIDPGRIGAFGFSAGGHLASTVAIHFDTSFRLAPQDALDQTSARVDFLGLGYPVISMDPAQFASPNSLAHLLNGYEGSQLSQLEQYLSGQKQVSKTTPPVFLFESWDDKQISSENSSLFCEALNEAQVPLECHIFQKGLHGDGLARDQAAESAWPKLFQKWLGERGFVQAAPVPAPR